MRTVIRPQQFGDLRCQSASVSVIRAASAARPGVASFEQDGARRMERWMNSANPNPSTTPTSPPERAGRLALFGPPPLLEGEDTAAYDEFLVRISGAVKPADILEEIWVRDVV